MEGGAGRKNAQKGKRLAAFTNGSNSAKLSLTFCAWKDLIVTQLRENYAKVTESARACSYYSS